MEQEKSDQEAFDERVNTVGKLVLQILAGVGVFAALIMSLIALLISSDKSNATNTAGPGMMAAAAAPARASAPTSARIMIDHVMRGCHNLAVNGGAPDSPNATLRLAVGGRMYVQNNDVMPHQLVLRSGPRLKLAGAMMNHMGASSAVTFPSAGVYVLTTKPGEDYQKGVMTVGADHKLRIKVLVS
jgi:plastocyanin